jgi:hypothetical protein
MKSPSTTIDNTPLRRNKALAARLQSGGSTNWKRSLIMRPVWPGSLNTVLLSGMHGSFS